jgi:hypothetical protein
MRVFTYHQLKSQECTLLAYISETGMVQLKKRTMIAKNIKIMPHWGKNTYLQVAFHMVYR